LPVALDRDPPIAEHGRLRYGRARGEELEAGSLQIAVSFAVAVSFLAAAVATWMRAATIDTDVDDIVANAMPSVRLISP
jgi:hypothetical protein